jgi:hypothetical protein
MGANNITMTGSLGATGARLTKGWFTDIESTNMPTVNGTSLSSTFAGIGQTMYIGTTAHTLNRSSAAEGLTGITGITPGADFTLTQNSVVPFTSVESGAVANTLYLKAGNVGIGTTSPSALLTVGNNNQFTVSAAGTVNAAGNIYFSGQYSSGYLNGNSSVARLVGDTGRALSLGSNGTYDALYITTTGNVGIGTTTPLTKFDVYSPTAAIHGFSGGAGSGMWTMGYDVTNNRFAIASSSSITSNVRMVIDNNGNVGIGTTGPASTLFVQGSGSNSIFTIASSTGSSIWTVGANGNLLTGTDNAYDIGGNGVSRPKNIFAAGNIYGGYLVGNGGALGSGYLGLTMYSNYGIQWANSTSDINATRDTSIGRGAAGKVYIGNGTLSDYSGTLIAGNVGIGTTSPQVNLDVEGNTPYIRLVNTATGGQTAQIFAGTTGIGFGTPATAQQFVVTSSAVANTLTVNSSGIQITGAVRAAGGTNLSIQSDANGTVGNTFQLQGYNGSGWQTVVSAPNVASGNVNLVLAQNNGNVGIGTMGPGAKLDINAPSGTSLLNLYSGAAGANVISVDQYGQLVAKHGFQIQASYGYNGTGVLEISSRARRELSRPAPRRARAAGPARCPVLSLRSSSQRAAGGS